MKHLSILAAGLIAPTLAFADFRGMDDAQIVDVVMTANRVAIDTGLLAESKSSNHAVKAFAQRKMTDHNAMHRLAAELVEKLGLAPRDSMIGNELRTDNEKGFAELAAMQGIEFDKAYIDQNVVLHQHVLDTIDNRLMPSAKRRIEGAAVQNVCAVIRPP